MLGLLLLTFSALAQGLGTLYADFNETHVLNPRWPPHARFHNGQTMSLGLLLGAASLYYAYRPVPAAAKADSLFTAALLASLYWVAGLSAILYPGTAWVDPEFGTGAPQAGLFVGFLAAAWVGSWLEMRGVRGKGKGA
ncbi:hypothetical protein MMC13_000418 [Lambiella insularis]|nr:hypothetical protein [Lambiella insularis]